MKVYTQRSSTYEVAERLEYEASFVPYINFLRAKMNNILDIRVKFYKYIISKFERNPELLEPFGDITVLEDHEEIIQLLRMSLLPLAAHSDNFNMALTFMKPSTIFYYTEPFKKLLIDEKVEFNTKEDELNNLRYLIKLVAERCYNILLDNDLKIVKQVYSEARHIVRHQEVIIDSRFIQVHTIGELPAFNQGWLDMLYADEKRFLTLVEQFPFESFRFEGFCILYIEDVSKDVAINELKSANI